MRSIIVLGMCAAALALAVPVSALTSLPQTVEGIVQNVSEDRLAILSKDGEVRHLIEVQINEETQFAAPTSLADLHFGDKVRVEYTEEGSEKVAVTIAKVIMPLATEIPEGNRT